jgi:GNAT superfamily N-acetyltransferase
VAAGSILPTDPDPERFLVAEGKRGLVGAVALTPWAPEVVELGSLVSSETGRGLGSRLVQAAVAHAAAEGFATVVALTGIGDWFARRGFVASDTPPWALARGHEATGQALPGLTEKAERSCRVCPRLVGCRQVLLACSAAGTELQVAA